MKLQKGYESKYYISSFEGGGRGAGRAGPDQRYKTTYLVRLTLLQHLINKASYIFKSQKICFDK